MIIKDIFNRKRLDKDHKCIGSDEIHKCEYLGECQKSKEHFTECDKCDMLSECIRDNGLINIRTSHDDFDHYVLGVGGFCSRDPIGKVINAYRKFKPIYDTCLNDKVDCIFAKCDINAREVREPMFTLMKSLDELFEYYCE